MSQSSAYITLLSTGQAYHFTGVISVSHALSLKVFEKADTTELGSFVNGAKNQPDKVTLTVLETDAAHAAAGWAARMLDILAAVKRDRLLLRVTTPHHTYEDMLLTDISVSQDEEHPDGWMGDLTFTEYIPMAILTETKTEDNASTPKNTGAAAPPRVIQAPASPAPPPGDISRASAAGVSAGVGALVTGFLSLQSGSTLAQKLSLSGLDTERIRYIV